MFILYAVVIGLIAGVLLGGRPSGLGRLQFRLGWLAVVGFAAQVVLFSAPISDRIGALGAPLYVASTGLVFTVLVVNARIAGLPIVALGAASNLVAIVANGGFMPAAPAALVAAGKLPAAGYSNSAVLADPRLGPLTDVFALPTWLPFHNVFSVGDLLIGLGIALAIVLAMHADRAGGASRNLPRNRPVNSTDGSFGGGERGPSVRDEDDERPPSKDRPGQTRREAGTQSQGPRASRGRPAAGPTAVVSQVEVDT